MSPRFFPWELLPSENCFGQQNPFSSPIWLEPSDPPLNRVHLCLCRVFRIPILAQFLLGDIAVDTKYREDTLYQLCMSADSTH